MTGWGGTKGFGVIFSYDITTNKQNILVNFDSVNGSYTRSNLLLVRNTPLGVNEITNNINITASVYPNPANTQLNVEIQLQEGTNSNICLYNMMGEKVICEALTNKLTTLAIGKLSEGIYLYRITDSDGNLIKTDKVVITH